MQLVKRSSVQSKLSAPSGLSSFLLLGNDRTKLVNPKGYTVTKSSRLLSGRRQLPRPYLLPLLASLMLSLFQQAMEDIPSHQPQVLLKFLLRIIRRSPSHLRSVFDNTFSSPLHYRYRAPMFLFLHDLYHPANSGL